MRTSLTVAFGALLALVACSKEQPPPAAEAPDPAAEPVAAPEPAPEPVQLTTKDHVAKTVDCWAKFNAKDAALAGCFAENVNLEFVDTPRKLTGREAAVAMIDGYRTAFPDLQAKQAMVLGSGNKVVTIDLMTGTNTGPLMGNPATGKKVGLLAAHVFEKNDAGETQNESVYHDEAALLGQLGLNPAPHRAAIEALPNPTVTAIASDSPAEKARLATLEAMNAALNAHDPAALAAHVTDDFVMADQTMPADIEGKEANAKGFEGWIKAFPDAKFDQKWALAAGDYVVREVAFTGTNKGAIPEMGLKKPTNKEVSVRGLEVFQFEGDKAKRMWFLGNGLEMAVQLGLIERPAPPAAPAEGAAPSEGAAPPEGAAKPAEAPTQAEEG